MEPLTIFGIAAITFTLGWCIRDYNTTERKDLIKKTIRDEVEREIIEQKRPGGILSAGGEK